MSPEMEELVAYRLARARESLDEARCMAEAGHWHACPNRLYYACFYAVNALLVSKGLSSSKHSGVRSLLNRELVKTEKVSRQAGKLYNKLFDHRMALDYADFASPNPEEIQPWLEEARLFVDEISRLIESDESGAGEQ